MPPAASRHLLIGFGIVLAIVVTACSGGDDPATTAAATAPVATSSAPTTTVTVLEPDVTLPLAVVFDVQGHRGARGLQPENTLPAFETALDLGVSTLEFDLHLAADGEVVVWHDAAVDSDKCGLSPEAPSGTPDPDDATTTAEDLMIRNLDPSQLAAYRCDRNPEEGRFPDQAPTPTALAGDDYSIVTLGELLDFVGDYVRSDAKTRERRDNATLVRFNMETKRKPDRPETIDDGFDGVNVGPFESRVLAIIGERGLEDRSVIQSFDHRSLWAVHAEVPTIALAALTRTSEVDLEALAARGASIWSPDHQSLTGSSLEAAHRAGLEVIPWTVNEPDLMDRLVGLGVDGLITDRPDVLLERLSADG